MSENAWLHLCVAVYSFCESFVICGLACGIVLSQHFSFKRDKR